MRALRVVSIEAALMTLAAVAAAQAPLTTADRDAIHALTTEYLSALRACDGERYAGLFAPGTGYFASGFRGQMTGREQLIALVESERHCLAPAETTASRPSSTEPGPEVAIEVTSDGVFGVVDLGTAQYHDEYVATADGWRFASRWVLIADELAVGLDARAMQAIRNLSTAALGEHYADDGLGGERLLHAGVTIAVSGTAITGRVYLDDGSYYDDVYERTAPGQWRIVSRERVTAQR